MSVEDVYQELSEWRSREQDRLSPENLIRLATCVIPLVQRVVKGTGEEKKEVALAVIQKVITESNVENKELLVSICNTTLPVAIDTMISIAKGRIDLSKGVKGTCFSCVV